MERAAISRCWLVCGLWSAGVFQHRKVALLLSLVAFAAAARARHRHLARPPRAQQAVRSGLLCCRIIDARLLTPQLSDVTGAQDEGKGGGGDGGTIIAFFGDILGDAWRRLCAAAAHSRPFDPACCVEK